MLLLLSGPVGSGKTTLCQRVARAARERAMPTDGILAPAVLEDGSKLGIDAVDLGQGVTRLMARTDRDLGGVQVGPYSFDEGVLSWAASVCERALEGSGLVFVDEIGRLELNRGLGLAPVIPLLTRPRGGHTVVVVRDFLTSVLVDRLGPSSPFVVRLDPERREGAWTALQRLLFDIRCP